MSSPAKLGQDSCIFIKKIGPGQDQGVGDCMRPKQHAQSIYYKRKTYINRINYPKRCSGR